MFGWNAATGRNTEKWPLTSAAWASAYRGKWGQLTPPWKIDIFIFIQIHFRMHHFVVRFSKFSSPQAARGHWPLTRILRTPLMSSIGVGLLTCAVNLCIFQTRRHVFVAGKGVLNVLDGDLSKWCLPFKCCDFAALTVGCKLASFYHLYLLFYYYDVIPRVQLYNRL